ncbi:MAG: EAL domain-containing protein [Gammaproteobacteria bacterium]|nr:EAL domain-containing protein [Gammaproteobacteria bacterium]
MSDNQIRTLGIVAVQHELAMAIGLDLNLERMLQIFMRTCVRRLGLRSIQILFDRSGDDPTIVDGVISIDERIRRISLPRMDRKAPSLALMKSLAYQVEASAVIHQTVGDRHYTAYRMPKVGCAIVERVNNVLDGNVARSLIPVFERLALSCLACIEHQRALNEVAARKQAEAMVVHQSSYDSLTDLPNRLTLYRWLRKSLAAAIRHERYGAVFFIDLDRFKYVNDSFGHGIGDSLLVAFSQRLQDIARAEDTLARVGGDEFILVVNDLGHDATVAESSARVIAERISEIGKTPTNVDGLSIHVSTSVGITLFPRLEETGDLDTQCEALIRHADTAMYHAKEAGRDRYVFFSMDMLNALNRRLQIERELRQALSREEFMLLYQPLVSLHGDIVGAEALLRWNNRTLGFVSPAEFIPVAEEAGLIVGIGMWVIQRACAVVKRVYAPSGASTFRYLSVNVSPRQVWQTNFVEQVAECVRHAGISPSALRLEITESAALDNIDDTIRKIQRLNKVGIGFALDDFGTGYSSLSHLHRLPVSALKIDRSFVTGISRHPENQVIADATIAMATHLQLECIVEGVETQDDVDYFKDRPIHAMQGYFFAKPMSEEAFFELLARGRALSQPRLQA